MALFKKKETKDIDFIPPWPDSAANEIRFPFLCFERLLEHLGWTYSDWVEYWLANNGENLAANYWSKGTKKDWIWGLGLPLLSDINRPFFLEGNRKILGISALPGCGKSSLGRWLEASAKRLNLQINVLSLDDFYLPGPQLEKAMLGNPWDVPRGLPGSHDIKLLGNILDRWVDTGDLLAPRFDKALRNGLGDRSGWISSTPKVLVIEGWFLGCNPLTFVDKPYHSSEKSFTEEELQYRIYVQSKLKEYEPIWTKINRVWHIKPEDFNSTCKWKVDQENKLFEERGSSLRGDLLDSFVRMIQCSIPQQSFNNIDSDVVIEINTSREILWSGITSDFPMTFR